MQRTQSENRTPHISRLTAERIGVLMAIYHLHAQMISRSSGRSAVAAAAYRSGDTLTNEYDGVTHDYSEKYNIEYTEIILPDHAPAAYKDRSVLWNAVESSEKNSNAQLAREIEVALPEELSLEEQKALVREYCKTNFVSQGMIADFAIHNPPLMDGKKHPLDTEGNRTSDPDKMIYQNPHCHIMLTVRPIDENGKWESKSKQQYVCVRDTDSGRETEKFTAEDFNKAQDEGWQKQYQFKQGKKKKVWMTQAEGEAAGLERVNKFPKTEKLQNETVERWNAKDRIFEWREHWAQAANVALEKAGREERIDHRSYQDQGIEKIPTIHMGPNAVQMEREGIETDVGNLNRAIKAENNRMQKLREQLREMVDAAKKFAENTKEKAKAAYEKTAHVLEGIRAQFIGASYREDVYERRRKSLEFRLYNGSRLSNVQRAEEQRLQSVKSEDKYQKKVKSLQKEIKGLSGIEKLMREGGLKKELAETQERIERLHEADHQVYRACGYNSAEEVQQDYKKCQKEEKALLKVQKTLQELKKSQKQDVIEFQRASGTVSEDGRDQLDRTRMSVRQGYENHVKEDLKEEFGEHYAEWRYDQSVKKADHTLKYDEGEGRRKSIHKELERGQEEVQRREEERAQEHDREERSHDHKHSGR